MNHLGYTEIHFEQIDSTSAYAKREFRSFDPNKITLISADAQTSGYGRYGRTWISPPNVNLLLTFCFQLASNAANLSLLAIIGTYSVAVILEKKGLNPKIKWPNDIQLNGKKIGGVLCEIVFHNSATQIFLGIGINVNMEEIDLKKIDQPATSLKNETGKIWDRDALKQELIEQLKADLERLKKEGFLPFHRYIENHLSYKNERVSCFDGKKKWVGICHSLDLDGRLVLLLEDGTIHKLYAGDIE